MKYLHLLFLMLGTTWAAAVQAGSENPFNPSLWPVGFKLPQEIVESWKEKNTEKMLKSPDPDILVWTPPDAKHVRSVLLIANNTDLVLIGQHKTIREMATRQQIGIVYLQNFSGAVIEWAEPPSEVADKTFAAVLNLAAEKTGIAEFRHAPWITLGKSSRGRFPFRTAWQFPDRVIASINHHGETPTWPMPAWSKAGNDESIMHLSIQGLSEWDGTWYRHVRPSLLNYHRHTNWLTHQTVIYGVDHSFYMDYYIYPNFGKPLEKNHRFIRCTDVWDYIALFIDKAMALRVPQDSYPTDKPTTLINVKRESGYLVHPRAPEELLAIKWFAFRKGANGDYQNIPWPEEVTPVLDTTQGTVPVADLIKPASQVPEAEQRDYLWIADKELARAWLKLHSLYYKPEQVLP